MPAVEVTFAKDATRRYRSTLRRADGVLVELEGGSYNRIGGPAGTVPHDIAHLVVEEALALDRGVWGVLVAGGLFRGARVLAGRRRPHADRLAREILEASVEQLNQAEILTRAVCDQAPAQRADLPALRRATGARWWAETATQDAVEAAIGRLRAASERWAAVEPGETLTLTWRPPPPRRP